MKNIEQGIRKFNKLPIGWRILKGASHPVGAKWIDNGKSILREYDEYESGLLIMQPKQKHSKGAAKTLKKHF